MAYVGPIFAKCPEEGSWTASYEHLGYTQDVDPVFLEVDERPGPIKRLAVFTGDPFITPYPGHPADTRRRVRRS
jgi:hypothetical protein